MPKETVHLLFRMFSRSSTEHWDFGMRVRKYFCAYICFRRGVVRYERWEGTARR